MSARWAALVLAAATLALVASLAISLLPQLEHTIRALETATATHTSSPRSAAGQMRTTHGRSPNAAASAAKRGSNGTGADAAGLLLGLLSAAAATALISIALSAARLRARARRTYRYYPLHLTGHDQTLPEDLIAAISAIGQVVGERPARRMVHGQPVFGLMLTYDPDGGGELTLLVVCEERHVQALDAALQIAYPNVRVGFDFLPIYRPFEAEPLIPPALIRLRKARDPIYPLIDLEGREDQVSPVLEGVGELLHNLRRRASVRFVICPVDLTAGYLRARHRQLERNRRLLARLQASDDEASVDREEARQSIELNERAMFHVDVQIAAEDYETCKRLAGGLIGYPGMSTLVRRPMLLRRGVYRRRYPSFTPPLMMRGSRKLMSASELGYLLQLPSARLRVPLARIPEPRLPAPPEIDEARPRPVQDPLALTTSDSPAV